MISVSMDAPVLVDNDKIDKMFSPIIPREIVPDDVFDKVPHGIPIHGNIANEQSMQIYDDEQVQRHNRIYFQWNHTKHFCTFHERFLRR